MADKHELENLMRSTMENLRDMIDVNTVVGDIVETSDGTSIVPISKVVYKRQFLRLLLVLLLEEVNLENM